MPNSSEKTQKYAVTVIDFRSLNSRCSISETRGVRRDCKTTNRKFHRRQRFRSEHESVDATRNSDKQSASHDDVVVASNHGKLFICFPSFSCVVSGGNDPNQFGKQLTPDCRRKQMLFVTGLVEPEAVTAPKYPFDPKTVEPFGYMKRVER